MKRSDHSTQTGVVDQRASLKLVLGETRIFTFSGSGDWGRLPGISVISGLGLLVVAIANTGARFESAWAVPLFWLGILTLYIPVTIRLISIHPTREERLGLVLILCLGLYFVKVLHSPVAFTFGDEFAHWRTADDILQLRTVFNTNPLLNVSAYYPGLEIVTSALVSMSGMTIFQAGIVVLFAARVVLTLSLFLFFERASHSARVAGVASVLYTANPNYVFWGSQFSYESLALPLASLVVLAIAILVSLSDKYMRRELHLVIVIVIFAIIPTHHMTSYVLISFLALWVFVVALKKHNLDLVDKLSRPVRWGVNKIAFHSRLFQNFINQVLIPYQSENRNNPVQNEQPPLGLVFLTLIITVTWLVGVANLTIGYLSPVLGGAITEFLELMAGDSAPKQVFSAIPGRETPLWERLIAFGAIGLILLGLTFGWIQLWRRHRLNIVALVLATGVLAYPITLAMRLTEKGTETSNRSSEFLFVALSLVVTFGILEIWLFDRPSWVRSFVAVAYLTIIFIGGVVVGFAPWTRMPGPYQVGGDTRAIQPQSIAAAEWMYRVLGPNNRVISDGTNRILLGSYGRQFTVSGASWVFFSPIMGSLELGTLEDKQIRYLLVDWRLSTALPINGEYFESGEPGAGRHKNPIDLKLLEKFDWVPGVSRLFDSGDIVIYDVESIWRKP